MNITKIKIENFMSFVSAEFTFPTTGVFNLAGINRDVLQNGVPTSNGSGKTSLLLALTQGLFNRVPSSITVDQVNNMVTNKPFNIVVDFEVDGVDYRVINDRNTLLMQLYNLTTGELVANKIKETVKMVEQLLKLDYHQFVKLTFVTPNTLDNMFLTDKSIIAEHFQLSKIDSITAALQSKRRSLNNEVKVLDARLQEAKATNVVQFSAEDIERELAFIQKEKEELQTHRFIRNGGKLAGRLNKLHDRQKYFDQLLATLSQNEQLLGLKVCPTCGQELKEDIEDTNRDQKILAKHELEEIQREIYDLNSEYKSLEAEYNKASAVLDNKLRVADSKKITLEMVKTGSNNNLGKLESQLKAVRDEYKIVKDTLDFVQNGNIVLAHLHTFLLQLQEELDKITTEVGFPFRVVPEIRQSKLVYLVYNKEEQEVDINLLSGGEKTTAALLILYTFLKLLKDTFGVKLPFVVFDEVFARIDPVNIKSISQLIQEFGKLTTIIVIQHHNEIEESIFTEQITVEKIGGISSVI